MEFPGRHSSGCVYEGVSMRGPPQRDIAGGTKSFKVAADKRGFYCVLEDASHPESAIKTWMYPGEQEVTLPICQAERIGSVDPHRGSVTKNDVHPFLSLSL